jgi:hypothetical protein
MAAHKGGTSRNNPPHHQLQSRYLAVKAQLSNIQRDPASPAMLYWAVLVQCVNNSTHPTGPQCRQHTCHPDAQQQLRPLHWCAALPYVARCPAEANQRGAQSLWLSCGHCTVCRLGGAGQRDTAGTLFSPNAIAAMHCIATSLNALHPARAAAAGICSAAQYCMLTLLISKTSKLQPHPPCSNSPNL